MISGVDNFYSNLVIISYLDLQFKEVCNSHCRSKELSNTVRLRNCCKITAYFEKRTSDCLYPAIRFIKDR